MCSCGPEIEFEYHHPGGNFKDGMDRYTPNEYGDRLLTFMEHHRAEVLKALGLEVPTGD